MAPTPAGGVRQGLPAAFWCCVLLVTGCSAVDATGLPHADRWHAGLAHAPLPARWVRMPAGTGAAACGHYRDGRPAATCAIRDYTDGTCWIYSEYAEGDAPAWLVDHEVEHCRGRDHDPY